MRLPAVATALRQPHAAPAGALRRLGRARRRPGGGRRRAAGGLALAGALVAVAGCQGDSAQQTRDEWTSYLRLDRAAAVAPAPDGGAWVGTRAAGLVRWSAGGTEHERLPLPAGLDDRDLSAVAVTDGGGVWVAAADPRVTYPDPGGSDAGLSTSASSAAGAEADRAPGDAASGSAGGVARLDAGQWTTWTAGDGLAHSAVTALAVAGDESVWAATLQGLSHFDGDGWTTYTRADGLAHDRVVSVAAGDDGTVWAVTCCEPRGASATPDEHGDGGDADPQPPQFGLSRFDGDGWTTWTTGDDLDVSHLGRLAVADDGSVWIDVSFGPDRPQGAGSALAHFDGQRWRTWTGDDHHGLGLGGAKALAVADDGAVWAATAEGVARFAGGQWTTWGHDGELAGDPVNAVAAAGGTVWAATAHGVSVFDGGGWATWATDSSPPGKLDELAVAGDGAVWAAIPHGVARFADGRWTTWTPRDSGLEGFIGYSVAADGQAVWAATLEGFDGLARFRAGEWTTHMPPQSGGDGQPSGYRITDLAVTADATVWAAVDRGVVRLADGQWITWTADDGLPRKQVTDLAVGADGTVWAAVQQSGVWRFTDGQWTATTTPDDGLGRHRVQALAAGDGTVWAGTQDSGVWRFDGDGWSAVDAALPARRVTAMTVAGDGALWVATGRATATGAPAGGVARFAGGQWTTWTADDGLAAKWIEAIAVGDDGTVWAGSDHGLSRFTP